MINYKCLKDTVLELILVNEGRAKELFFSYYGNEFFMWKDGELEEYRTHNISKEQELIWKEELVKKLYLDLDVKHNSTLSGLCIIIKYFGDYNLFNRVFNFISNNYQGADSFLKIRYAEDLFDLMENCINFHENCPGELMETTKELTIEILNSVIDSEIIINQESEIILEFNKNIPNRDYLTNRAQDLSERINKFTIC